MLLAMFARDYKRIDSVGMPATLPFSVYWEQGTSVADVWEEEVRHLGVGFG